MVVSSGLHRWTGKASFDWIRLYLDMRLRIIVREWLRQGLSGVVFNLFAQTSAPADQSPDRPRNEARSDARTFPANGARAGTESEEVRTPVSGDEEVR